MRTPKLRDSKNRTSKELYPLGEIPKEYLHKLSKWLTYFYAIGKKDITGDDWGDAFSEAINATHLASPLGLADVVLEKQSWSTKTVKNQKPLTCKSIRIISGRNSPDYSYGIQNPHEDAQKTGTAVLGIWNERINIALDQYQSLRSVTLIRNFKSLEFCLFENDIKRAPTNEYEWTFNKQGNLEGYNISSKKHAFTWQPHGSQFTVKSDVPKSALKFRLKKPPTLNFEQTLEQIGFNEDWLEILD